MKPFIFLLTMMMVISFSISGQSSSQAQAFYTNSTDSVRIAYEVFGEGKPAIVFVHGWSCDRHFIKVFHIVSWR